MSATLSNGRPHQQRKQLSDQLDRLDQMIDCLSEALPQAVADATREGTRAAVRDILAEVLRDPEIVARLRDALGVSTAAAPTPVTATSEAAPVPAAVAGTGFREQAKATTRGVTAIIAAKLKQAFAAIKARAQAAKDRAAQAIRAAKDVVPLRRFAMVAAAVGVSVAIVSYAAPQGFSAVISGIGGAAIAAGVQTYRWLRRSARSFGLLA
jgi:uncharacterized protein YjeT (DUF2065 family)